MSSKITLEAFAKLNKADMQTAFAAERDITLRVVETNKKLVMDLDAHARMGVAEAFDFFLNRFAQPITEITYMGDYREKDIGWKAQVTLSQKLLDGTWYLAQGHTNKDKDRKPGQEELTQAAEASCQLALKAGQPHRELMSVYKSHAALNNNIKALDQATRARLYGLTGNTHTAWNEPKASAPYAAKGNIQQLPAETPMTADERKEAEALGFSVPDVNTGLNVDPKEEAARQRLNDAADKVASAANDTTTGQVDQKVY